MVFAWVRGTEMPATVLVAIVGFVITATLAILLVLLVSSLSFRQKVWDSRTPLSRSRFLLLLAVNSVGAVAVWSVVAKAP
jgi:hypothetical protein